MKQKKIQVFSIWLVIMLLIACEKDELINSCEKDESLIVSTGEFSEFPDFSAHLKTINLPNEIGVVTRNYIRFISKKENSVNYELIDLDIHGIDVNKYDTIIQMNNTFYKFFPSQRRFEFIYSPPYTIHDFSVIPGHGIGFFWGNVFVESTKFNYYDFETKSNKTIFEYSEFIPDFPYPYSQYIIFLLNDRPHLYMNVLGQYTYSGTLYLIDIKEASILSRSEYADKKELKFLGRVIDGKLRVKYEKYASTGIIQLGGFLENDGIKEWSYPNGFGESEISYESNHFAILTKGYNNSKVDLYDWNQNEKILSFSVNTANAIFNRISISSNNIVYFNSKRDELEVYNYEGCKGETLKAQRNVSKVIFVDNEVVLILNEENKYELFRI